jgi:hypothetical protein
MFDGHVIDSSIERPSTSDFNPGDLCDGSIDLHIEH